MRQWSSARPAACLLLLCTFGAGPDLGRAQEMVETDPATVAVLRQAQSLLAERKPEEAYTLLAGHELNLAGTALYDYLLGVAALDSGRAADAAFALERVVAAQPDFSGARIELARAQFERGDVALARGQFEYLLTQSPPPATREVIERYLKAIGERGTSGSRWAGLAQFGAGYDSNANGSTAEQTFLGFTLNPQNVETSSGFGELMLGLRNTLGLGPSSGLISNAQVSHRANPDASFIDQTVVALSTGLVWVRGSTRFTAGVDGYQGWLDGENHERGINLNADVARRMGDFEAALNVRAGTLEYEVPSLQILDADRYLAGLSFTRLNIGDRSGRIGISLLAGTDEAKQSGSPYGNDRTGARLFASWLLMPQSSLYMEVSSMTVDYDGPFFGTPRKDDQLSALVSLDLQNFPAARWSLAPRIRFMKTDSDLSLYDYDRVEAGIYVRRSF